MKNILKILLTLAFVIGFAFAEKIQVTKTEIIRSAVMAKDNVGIAKAGDIFPVLEEIGAWHYISVPGGDGWAWQNLLDTKNLIIKGDQTVAGVPGVNLHVEPRTDSKIVCAVSAGTPYKLIKILVKWYKVGEDRYIYYYNTKKISE
jgi:SH3-like domain-containing protein